MKRSFILTLLALTFFILLGQVRAKYNFNSQWRLHVGDVATASQNKFDDDTWQQVTLPHAFNEDEAFRLDVKDLTDTVVWYRKHFELPASAKGNKVFIEFEGARQGIDCYVNGQLVGQHENGVMAFGFDLTPYIRYKGDNVIACRIDNNWDYAERATGTKYQWSNRNFNANYGGLPKNVWLHVTGSIYQTLPLYSNLKTTGVYVYATQIHVPNGQAMILAESEVRNESKVPATVGYRVQIQDREGQEIAAFEGSSQTLAPGETQTLSAEQLVEGLHFWSWGYGYLYHVKTSLLVNGQEVDVVTTTTGFRKTRFAEGKVWLNDRVIQLKGFAQRTSNEWPAVGMSVPAWLSDYSNGLMVSGNANLVRWMHVTPWKQDVESCDRVGLIQAMPAGDAEKDCQGVQWQQRCQLMRDAIIYNRNNPSILFYEGGNESISREHMLELKQIRDEFDPHGGRAIGSREMLDIREAEYGGEMLYINKSAHHPMWAMEYSRDEGLRKYWDEYSYPYHKEGDGKASAKIPDPSPYNHNQDHLALESVWRWCDYYHERPGTGSRVSSGGAKIIFSDSNTHYRGGANYRSSGVTDALRIPKDAFFANQVMWDGWVDVETPRVYIIGHWNYEAPLRKPIYVVANTDSVQLLLNGRPVPGGVRSNEFLYTYNNVSYQPGTLEVVGYNCQQAVCRYQIQTTGAPTAIRLHEILSPKGWKADGADLALVKVEVVDAEGRRCPLANDMIRFSLDGAAQWRGGLAQGPDNYILSRELPVECGVNRVLLRSTTQAGQVRLHAESVGLKGADLVLETQPLPKEVSRGLSTYLPNRELEGWLTRGETPLSPSYTDRVTDVPIVSALSGCNQETVACSFDDNELSEWKNDGHLSTAWIKYQLAREARIDEVCMKLTGWRMRSYPIDIFAGDELIWSGETEKSLGYIHLKVKPVLAREITVRLRGSASEEDAFGAIVEVAAPAAGELDLFKSKGGAEVGHELRIVEIEFKENHNHFANIRDFGAKGDGVTIDSDAINTAIQHVASQGGGRVEVPAGRYACYSIHLASHVELHLAEGAVIVAAKPEGERGFDLPEDNPHDKYQDFGHSHWQNSLFWGIGLTDVAITGHGLVDGSNLSRWGGKPYNVANKAIGLRECRNVRLQDFSMLRCGHFALLATDVDSLTIIGMRIDTNRDALDIDCCTNVLVADCEVNSPWDDAIVLKACYSLGRFKDCENIVVTRCHVSGYDCGTLLDGTRQLVGDLAPDGGGRTGRIKIGTESSGGFRNISITDCDFKHCRGLALETVDGGHLEDVVVRNLTMDHIVNAPIFMRLGARLRSPEGTPVGTLKNVSISNIKATNVDSRYCTILAGIPGHQIENVTLRNIDITHVGGCALTDSIILPEPPGGLRHQRDTQYVVNLNQEVLEYENVYPEPWMFGITHAKGLFLRHVKGLTLDNVRISSADEDSRPYSLLEDVQDLQDIRDDK